MFFPPVFSFLSLFFYFFLFCKWNSLLVVSDVWGCTEADMSCHHHLNWGYSVAHEYEQMANINLLHEVHLPSFYYRTIDPSKMNSNARKAFRFKLHRALPDLKDDGIKKINMLIIFPPYSSFRHLRRVIVERVNKMTVLSTNDCKAHGPCLRSAKCICPGHYLYYFY